MLEKYYLSAAFRTFEAFPPRFSRAGVTPKTVRMKKLLLAFCVYLTPVLFSYDSSADTPVESPSSTAASSSKEEYIKAIYESFDFAKAGNLKYEVFEKAMTGYLNLRAAGKLNNKRPILTIVDFTKSSSQYRMWILDLEKKKVLINHYVAHGQGTGDEFARAFSNQNESHQSSLGFYVTGDTYVGQHGNSLRLHGMDAGFNNAAYDRAIVVHGAAYVCKEFVQSQGRIGRSWGCPAVSNQLAPQIIDAIRGGTAMFLYYPQKQYLASSVWLNKKVEKLPNELLNNAKLQRPMLAVATPAAQKDTVVVNLPYGTVSAAVPATL